MNTTTETAEAVKVEAPAVTSTRLAVINIAHTELLLPENMNSSERITLISMLERCRMLRDRYDTGRSACVYRIEQSAPDITLSITNRLIEKEAE